MQTYQVTITNFIRYTQTVTAKDAREAKQKAFENFLEGNLMPDYSVVDGFVNGVDQDECREEVPPAR